MVNPNEDEGPVDREKEFELYETAIEHHRQTMLWKLKQHAAKRDWKSMPVLYLLKRSIDELGELVIALMENRPKKDIENEAADVSNLCMMLADNYEPQVTSQPAPPDYDERLGQDIANLLNELLEADRLAVEKFMELSVPVNGAIVDHPTVCIATIGGQVCLRVIGLLNGLCKGRKRLVAMYVGGSLERVDFREYEKV